MTLIEQEPHKPSIADPYRDLLAPLHPDHRMSLIRRLAFGYYEGWRPSRKALAALIASETRTQAAPGRRA